MRTVELEIEMKDEEEARQLSGSLMNGENWVGRKNGKSVLFISCPADEIMKLGYELHYGLDY
ncbi:hypothetical protein [Maritalea porphyrae]|uniref:hypothetical protein n=1 Tax=Maritalea porphyrae TaxID=880732 RepID=UPI0022AFF24A|nr:hypothetical protein [Maritalea porphyrae]MCZ4270936.1 hypothetical protein [Maritalea porphyrae]